MFPHKSFRLGIATIVGLLFVVALLSLALFMPSRGLLQSATVDASGQASPAIQGVPVGQVNTLVVQGNGIAATAPDVARINLGVESRAATAQDAVSTTNKKQGAVIEALKGKGIEAKDIQTTNFSVFAESKPNGEGPSSYRASNTVQVIVRKIDQVGAVLDAAVSAGANQVYGISFGLSDPESLLAEARAKAVANAKSKAEAIAKAAGVRLIKVVNISENFGGSPLPRGGFAAPEARANSAPIEAGETQVSAQVTIAYSIE